MKQEIAEKLKSSGLFGWVVTDGFEYCIVGNDGELCRGSWFKSATTGKVDLSSIAGPWPTADQSEEILADMGLQVMYSFTSKDWKIKAQNQETGFFMEFVCTLDLGNQGQRTLANNTALAWLCDNKPDELKTAIEEVRG